MIPNAFFVVKNDLWQRIDEIFTKLNVMETVFEKTTIYKINKQTKVADHFH